MRHHTRLALILVLAASDVRAQASVFFGAGKSPVFVQEDVDRRFARSRIARGLRDGPTDPSCAPLLAGLLTALADAAPRLHKRDETFFVDPHLRASLQHQLSSPAFPAEAYLAAMVRRVRIDGRMPESWLKTAEALAPSAPHLDVARLRKLAEGVEPIDSFFLTLPALKERYEVEVTRATSVSRKDSATEFRDGYLDREVAWDALELVDIRAPARGTVADEGGVPPLEATLHWSDPATSPSSKLMLFAIKPKPPVVVIAKLRTRQYVDLARLTRGSRLLVRGRLWDVKRDVALVELRDAVLFAHSDWDPHTVLADPNQVRRCPLAVNELAGIAPRQPGGFAP